MRQRITVQQALIVNGELQLRIDEEFDLNKLESTGQMLVDSDQLAFIYLAALNNEYLYISLPFDTWRSLKEALTENLPVIALNNQGRLVLHGFEEEMNYLIENIKGNSNYGEEMVGKVESIF